MQKEVKMCGNFLFFTSHQIKQTVKFTYNIKQDLHQIVIVKFNSLKRFYSFVFLPPSFIVKISLQINANNFLVVMYLNKISKFTEMSYELNKGDFIGKSVIIYIIKIKKVFWI